MKNYGKYFKALRESKGLTLRDVEKITDLSNAYISQLESNKIKQPSPKTLYQLAQVYGVKYEIMMEKAGYPVPKAEKTAKKTENMISHRFGEITDEEEIELLEYLKFIRNKKR